MMLAVLSPALTVILVYPLTLLISIWFLAALFAYTLKSTPYATKAPFTRNYVDPGLAYFKKKALVIGVDFAFVAFTKFRAKMGNDSNIEYHGHHCLVQIRDRGRHYKLYLPYHKNLRHEARYKITAEMDTTFPGERRIDHLHTVPGIPILVSPKEMGKDIIKCSKPNGEVVWSYREAERPVCHMIQNQVSKHIAPVHEKRRIRE